MSGFVPVRRALVSVYDKTGLPDLARALADIGAEILSTGSTARAIRDIGVAVTEVSQVTGFPEILDGRVKTLHPAIHAAILADRSKESHLAALREHGIAPIDLVVVNLYPFRDTVADPEVDASVAIEMIDIGGPTIVRAAAKNHAHVLVVVNPPYDGLIRHLREEGGSGLENRREAAAVAFAATASYDADVRDWLHRDQRFPPRFGPVYVRAQELRYGENPHQAAAYYVERGQPWGIGAARQLAGKELSYNNLLDTDAAWAAATDFDEPCVAIVKHTNPAGVALAASIAEAYPKALAGDPVSAFGGIVAANRPVDEATASQIAEIFTEVVAAPAFTEGALDVLRGRKNLRILEIPDGAQSDLSRLSLRSIAGGLLVQDADLLAEDPSAWTVPTKAQPDDETLAELRFAWQVCKQVKSNAIALTRGRALVGTGAGQMSRVDSVHLAVTKSGGRCDGAVLASDAFFPFRDGPDAALDAGVRAIIQPGGSVRDDETVAACDERGVPMVLTGRRHFRH